MAATCGLAGSVFGQADNDVVVDAAGVSLRCQLFGPCFPDQYRDSLANPLPAGTPQYILPASGYRYDITGVVATGGLLGSFIPNGSTLDEALDAILPGGSRVLHGYSRNDSGGLPDPVNQVFMQRYQGEFGGIEMGLSMSVAVSNTGIGQFRVYDIDIPLGILAGWMELTAGSATITTWVPSAPQESEWHFDGSLDAATGSAGAMIAYLDEVAFAPILGGMDHLDTPDPSTPVGVTAAQSSFATTTALGIPGPGGQVDTVYVTSPARNLSTGLAKDRRGIGLSVAPTLRPEFPGEFFGQWTMIWDMYIPASSWYADYPANTVVREFPVALLEDSANNNSSADLFIRNAGGVTRIGYNSDDFSQYIPIGIGPNQWFRLAVACDYFTAGASRVYLNGVYVGNIEADWLYCAVDPNHPEYGDGEDVEASDWTSWGGFPNPWAQSSGKEPGSTGPAPLSSTFSMFADLAGGRSEVAYLANYYFVDTALTGAEIAALGGPSAAGIVMVGAECAADMNADGVLNFFDVQQFLALFSAQDERADFVDDGQFDFFDVQAFLGAFSAGCP
ncbi:MAG: hypothetical protein DYG94_13475 [Leptolyngbya sp. PLA3]|nr:MAG: hypothetical protein EDM82_14030 [Cyanobacteria bacterium CYA]MCE7969736.1 hypothetical protein [Leptolyngbya sp. PL-A3]